MIEKIKDLLKQYNRSIIFYFDADGSFKEELEAIALEGFKVVTVKDNYFEIKYNIEFEWRKEQLFLYHPFEKPQGNALKKYPLLGLLKANPELRLDATSEFLAEHQLTENHTIIVNRYIELLKNKTVKKKLAKILDPTIFTDDNLKLGLISITLDFHSVANRNSCMVKLLSIALDEFKLNKTIRKLKELELDEVLLNWFNYLLDTNFKELNYETIKSVSSKLKYNVLTTYISKTASADSYAKLKLERNADINKVHSFFNDWQKHANLKEAIERVFTSLAYEIKTSNLVSWYGSEQEFGYYSEDMLETIIIGFYDTVFSDFLKTKDECIKWKRSANLESRLKNQILFLYHVASFLSVLNKYSSFKFNTPDDYINAYTNELYKVDLHYRKAILAFDKVRDHLYEFESKAMPIFNDFNQKYDRFLIEINKEWQNVLNENDFNFHSLKTEKQYDFYKNNLKDFDYKIVVIISDAMRYELGFELYNDLLADNKNELEITPYLASLPSYTNLGMSNLLPNQGLEVEKSDKDLVFKINDKKTISTNREAILKSAEPSSATLDYADVMKFNHETGRDYFKNNRIVYIYHDWIDSIGDKKRTEHETFDASTKAVEDIKRLTQKLYGWNVYHVLVTSDHGFLYNYNELTESSREQLPKTKGFAREHVRFVVADDFESKVDGYELPMKNTINAKTDLKIALPRAINRYRKSGNIGVQFVHGGASLQELIIPVVKFYKQTSKEKNQSVTFKRIDQNDRISSGSLKVTLIQDQPVNNELKSAEVILGLYSESGEVFSKEVEVHFNATSGNPKERIFEIILSLNTLGSNASFCYLKAFLKNDKSRLNPLGTNDLIKLNTLMEKDEF
jgi:uncharacterized protein (TIGR02687 family)